MVFGHERLAYQKFVSRDIGVQRLQIPQVCFALWAKAAKARVCQRVPFKKSRRLAEDR